MRLFIPLILLITATGQAQTESTWQRQRPADYDHGDDCGVQGGRPVKRN